MALLRSRQPARLAALAALTPPACREVLRRSLPRWARQRRRRWRRRPLPAEWRAPVSPLPSGGGVGVPVSPPAGGVTVPPPRRRCRPCRRRPCRRSAPPVPPSVPSGRRRRRRPARPRTSVLRDRRRSRGRRRCAAPRPSRSRWSRIADRLLHEVVPEQRRVGAAGDRLAAELGQHRLESVGIADPDRDRHLLVPADEPGVAVVLGRAGLAGGEAGDRARPCRCRRRRRSAGSAATCGATLGRDHLRALERLRVAQSATLPSPSRTRWMPTGPLSRRAQLRVPDALAARSRTSRTRAPCRAA